MNPKFAIELNIKKQNYRSADVPGLLKKHPFAYSVGAQRRCALNRASEEGAVALRPYDGFIIFINRGFSTAPSHRLCRSRLGRMDCHSIGEFSFNRESGTLSTQPAGRRRYENIQSRILGKSRDYGRYTQSRPRIISIRPLPLCDYPDEYPGADSQIYFFPDAASCPEHVRLYQ